MPLRLLLERWWRLLLQVVHPRERERVRLRARVAADHGTRVRRGPFRGMVYPAHPARRRSIFSPATRILGSFEAELHAIVERVVTDGYEHVIDVGCGEGYYAVGLALRMPDCVVDAYELDPTARAQCRELAATNRVLDRITVHPAASRASFQRPVATGGTFVKMDCEGCELELLQPDASDLLTRATILVELHDFRDPAITDTVLERFAPTHTAELVEWQPRFVKDYPELASLEAREAELIVAERRLHGNRWALLTPRAT